MKDKKKKKRSSECLRHTSLKIGITRLHCNLEKTFQEGLRQYGPKTLLRMKLNIRKEVENVDD